MSETDQWILAGVVLCWFAVAVWLSWKLLPLREVTAWSKHCEALYAQEVKNASICTHKAMTEAEALAQEMTASLQRDFDAAVQRNAIYDQQLSQMSRLLVALREERDYWRGKYDDVVVETTRRS